MKQFDIAYISEIGDREVNEDSLCCENKGGSFFLAVADGLGGSHHGDTASKSIIEYMQNCFVSRKSFLLSESIIEANKELCLKQENTKKKALSTVAAILLTNSKIEIANIGDSRVYLFQKNKIFYQSVDHSAAQVRVMLGELKKEKVRESKDRNILTKVLGESINLSVESTCFKVDEWDAILLCSDGFWENVFEKDMIKSLRKSKSSSSQEWIDRMMRFHKKRNKGNHDNYSCIAVIKKELKKRV